MSSNPIREAPTPEACEEALEAMLSGEADGGRRLALLFDAAMKYLRLEAFDRAEATIRRIAAYDGDLMPTEATEPSLKEAVFTRLAHLFRQTGREREAAAALADAARAALDAGRAIRAIHLVAAALRALPAKGPEATAPLLASAAEAAEVAPLGADLFEALAQVGYRAYEHGDAAAALRFQERALGLSAHGDAETVAGLLSNQVVIGLEAGDLRRVSRYGRRAAAATRAAGLGSPVTLLAYTAGAEAELGRSEEALALLDIVQSELPPSDEMRYARAQLLVDLKRYDEATPLLEELDIAGADLLRRRLARETSGPRAIDCAHRVLGMALEMRESEVEHVHEMPQRVIEPSAYQMPDLTDADRHYFDRLLGEFQQPLMQARWSEGSGGMPSTFVVATKLEYTTDVADFEHKWHLYELEREVKARRRDLQHNWDDFRKRHAGPRDVARSDVLDILDACATLGSLCRELASAGERDAFAVVAMYAADLLEAQYADPSAAAFAWAQRAQVIDAARLLAGEEVTVLRAELHRCQQQFTAIVRELEPKRAAALLAETLEGWIDIAEDEASGIDARELANLTVPLAPLLDASTRLLIGVALSFAGDHESACDVIDAVFDEVHRSAPDTPIEYPHRVGVAFAVARMASLCPDADTCGAVYGPFARPLFDEVVAWAPDALPFCFEPDEPVPTAQVPPLGFADPPLVVLHELFRTAHAPAIMHELSHILFRMGQMLRTSDGRWRLVKRDVPVASALTYYHVLYPESLAHSDAEDESPTLPGMDAIRALAAAGEAAARRDIAAAGRQIQNTLDYFDALGRQETPASYPCAALLAGMARALVGDGALSYLEHLEVTDHTEALRFGAQRASLQL